MEETKQEVSQENYITIDDLAKIEIKIGEIKSAEFVEGSEKLIRFKVDLGEGKERNIFSGVRKTFEEPSVLIGKKVPVVTNLAPRKMMGEFSEGMILYAVAEDNLSLISTDQNVANGTKIR